MTGDGKVDFLAGNDATVNVYNRYIYIDHNNDNTIS
jgi:hypothetical protein